MFFTKEQEKQIIDMYKNNVGIDEIIEYFNVQECDIRKILKENKVDRNYNFFSQELFDRIIFLYLEKKLNQSQVGREVLVTQRGVSTVLDRYNVQKRPETEIHRIFDRNSHYFDEINTPNKAYILGILYADGCNHINHNAIHLQLQERDKEILEKIKYEIEYEGPLRFNPTHEKNNRFQNSYILCINDEHMSKKLNELGVVNAKSLTLKFPTFLKEDLLSHFIRGYYDGDGCIYYYERFQKCQTQICGTRDFCEKLSEILTLMNIKHCIKHPKQCHENTVVLATNGNKSSYNFLSWLYKDADLKMNRKYQSYLSFCQKYGKKVA